MTNRPANKNTAKKWPKSPYDWYCDSPAVVEQLFSRVDFGNDYIWDPCCGRGNILDVAKQWGHETVGSDVVDRYPRHRFLRGNVLTQISRAPQMPGRPTSVITNPPYSYEPDIAERIIEKVLTRFEVRRAAFILPIAFLASQNRWSPARLQRWRPSQVCIYRERHTMPPGHLIDQMENPFDGGMQDYCAIVYTRPHRWRTELIWLPPGRHHPTPKKETANAQEQASA